MSSAAAGMCPAMVAVDWGTTACRFVLVDAEGSALARRNGPGILPLNASAHGGSTSREEIFGQSLREQIGDWLEAHPGIPLVMSGMVGADRGWRDAGYREVPVGLTPGREALVPVSVPGHPAYLVPGVKQRGRIPDVMRGEETQVLGALLEGAGGGVAGEALVIIPGTHSKWVQVSDGRIQHFRTYMTGDLFAALRGHTIHAAASTAAHGTAGTSDGDPGSSTAASARTAGASDAFLRGLELAVRDGKPSLSRHLFRARSEMVLGDLAPEHVHDVLSGLLIGDEVADALSLLSPDETTPVLLIASEVLGDHYRVALERAGLRPRPVGGDPATRGLHAIAGTLLDIPAHPHQERLQS